MQGLAEQGDEGGDDGEADEGEQLGPLVGDGVEGAGVGVVWLSGQVGAGVEQDDDEGEGGEEGGEAGHDRGRDDAGDADQDAERDQPDDGGHAGAVEHLLADGADHEQARDHEHEHGDGVAHPPSYATTAPQRGSGDPPARGAAAGAVIRATGGDEAGRGLGRGVATSGEATRKR